MNEEIKVLRASDLKCIYTRKDIKGEGIYLLLTDTEARKGGYQMGLETPVVHPVNYECFLFGNILGIVVNAKTFRLGTTIPQD